MFSPYVTDDTGRSRSRGWTVSGRGHRDGRRQVGASGEPQGSCVASEGRPRTGEVESLPRLVSVGVSGEG